MNPIKNSIALAIYNADRSQVLLVKRPKDDDLFPSMWGLPAGTLQENESWEDAVKRAARQKLGIEVEVTKMIAQGTQKRKHYQLFMREYEARIINGTPMAPQPPQEVSQYQGCKYGNPEELIETAQKGSLCCRLFLDYSKISY